MKYRFSMYEFTTAKPWLLTDYLDSSYFEYTLRRKLDTENC